MNAAPRATMNGKPVFHVPVKTVLNLDSKFREKLLCDGPALSLGDACAYRCSFCYVPAVYQKLDRVREVLDRENLRHEDVVILREGAIDVLREQLLHPSKTDDPCARKRRFPDPTDRRVVYSSPADDVAANMDLVRATVEACSLILRHTNWQIRLLSKSNLLPKVAAMLCDAASRGGPGIPFSVDSVHERMIFGFSTGTLSDEIAKVFEEGTPLVSKRINALHVLQDNGFRTFGMVCPSLPHPDRYSYDRFAEEVAAALRPEKLEHVWAEVINLRGESFKRTNAALLAGGFEPLAFAVDRVSHDADAWEEYNRLTFLAHAKVYSSYVGKLRYLTYVKEYTRPWWESQIAKGAVLLGKEAHQ